MKTTVLICSFLSCAAAFAQDHTSHHAHAQATGAGHSASYSGMQQREIKSLSEQQIADLKAGKGMSYALAAELNGYPGPAHVLELVSQLELSPEQKAATETLHRDMKAQAIMLGEQLISRENELDRFFRERQTDTSDLRAAVDSAAQAQASLRTAHLGYHLEMLKVLTPAQVEKYNQLRGYR